MPETIEWGEFQASVTICFLSRPEDWIIGRVKEVDLNHIVQKWGSNVASKGEQDYVIELDVATEGHVPKLWITRFHFQVSDITRIIRGIGAIGGD